VTITELDGLQCLSEVLSELGPEAQRKLFGLAIVALNRSAALTVRNAIAKARESTCKTS
jgi:hypothetical protein